MVSVDEIPEFEKNSIGNIEYEDLDTEASETFLERITGLVDIVDPVFVVKAEQAITTAVLLCLLPIQLNTISSLTKTVSGYTWAVTTTALILALPVALEIEREGVVIAQGTI